MVSKLHPFLLGRMCGCLKHGISGSKAVRSCWIICVNSIFKFLCFNYLKLGLMSARFILTGGEKQSGKYKA